MFAEYKKSGYSRDFFEVHRDVLTLRRAASSAFKEYEKQHPAKNGEKVKLPTVKELSAEYDEVLARKKKTYAEYRKDKEETKDYLMTQKILEAMFSEEQKATEQERQQEEHNREEHR